MCTVSVIPIAPGGGFRLVSNRDESRRRDGALPPRRHDLAGVGVGAWPTDPQGGGTWIGMGDQGLVVTLLNIYRGSSEDCAPRRAGERSRGELIPRVLDAADAEAVASALGRMDLSSYRGFRLVAVNRSAVVECRWDGAELEVAVHGAGAMCFSSHGRGDARAQHRLHLFRRWFADRPVTPEHQDAFHRHRWASRPDISVRMAREDARTVSITTVTVGGDGGATMRYEPLDCPGTADDAVVTLAPRAGVIGVCA